MYTNGTLLRAAPEGSGVEICNFFHIILSTKNVMRLSLCHLRVTKRSHYLGKRLSLTLGDF